MGRVGRSTPIREPSSTSSSEGTGSISSHLPRDSVFKHSYKGSLDRQMWGTEATEPASPGMPFQGLAATCLGWEEAEAWSLPP